LIFDSTLEKKQGKRAEKSFTIRRYLLLREDNTENQSCPTEDLGIWVGIAGSTKLAATGGKHQGKCATQNVASKRNNSSTHDAADIPSLVL
jgi:hypothetical protein